MKTLLLLLLSITTTLARPKAAAAASFGVTRNHWGLSSRGGGVQTEDDDNDSDDEILLDERVKETIERHLISAWKSHIYMPANITYTPALDAESKLRLDRRTLYGMLRQELSNSTSRKFLDDSTILTSAFAMASQPAWRKVYPRCSCLQLDDTYMSLSMQETTAMAVAHAMNACFLILDDDILDAVKSYLRSQSYNDLDLKTTSLIQSVLALAKQGVLEGDGNLTDLMKSDLDSGLDDPFDTSAVLSSEQTIPTVNLENAPLVIFLRTDHASSILKSKSAVDTLLHEADSDSSRNLLILGSGIDASTDVLPELPEETPEEVMQPPPMQNDFGGGMPGNLPGAAPWFGFTNQNQNASGQNDPEGSRRFNIFLARTMQDGKPTILGAVAPPEAGNLFPHMMTMRENGVDPPPSFFNASLSSNEPPPSPETIQKTLETAMSELLDRLANEGMSSGAPDMPPELQKAFSQVLRNENLRRGIAENLARAAPALSDPKCQGVLLSVFVPPPNMTGKLPQGKSGWFQKMLKNQEEEEMSSKERNSKAKEEVPKENMSKADRNLAKLHGIAQNIQIGIPSDPVRAKAWKGWLHRERGSVIFRQNRQLLNEELETHRLRLHEHTGTRGAGSALRQMLSVRFVEEMCSVIHRAVQIEAEKAQQNISHALLEPDITLSQLVLTDDGGMVASEEVVDALQLLHPSSLEAALSQVCNISPSPSGGLSVQQTHFRSREEINNLAQDKHERALLSQVVSPQDVGVTYDMIGGLKEVKELLRQSITYPLKFPHLYNEGIAREAVKGVLLFGPPGTGKTLLAKAVATEGGASFLSVDASSVENKWLGESEKNAKAVFTLARRLAPCVVFIDEVDSLLSSREGASDDSAHGTLTSVKTTMMSEWDGLNSGTNGSSDRVVVIGSTNRPFDLDEAVLRRFPRRILVDLPDLTTRTEILQVTLAENRLDPGVNLTAIAEELEGYTGSDIKEVCREAVVQISHEQAKALDEGLIDDDFARLRPVNMQDFETAMSKLKRSVSETGRELAKVWEWNDEYGEIKKDKNSKLPHLANMYL